jgi:hypothetical protein
MRKVAYIAMWRNTVIMATGNVATTVIPATGIVAMGIVAMGIPTGGTTEVITGLITGATIMATHMVATTAGIIKVPVWLLLRTEEEGRSRRAGVEAPAIMSLLLLNFIRM